MPPNKYLGSFEKFIYKNYMCTECEHFIQKPFEHQTIRTGKKHGNWEIQVTEWLNICNYSKQKYYTCIKNVEAFTKR